MDRDKNISPISLIIKQLIKKNNLTQGLQKAQASEIWARLMGEAIQRKTLFVALENDTFRVQLASAALCQELLFGKEKIMKMINEEYGSEIVKKIIITA